MGGRRGLSAGCVAHAVVMELCKLQVFSQLCFKVQVGHAASSGRWPLQPLREEQEPCCTMALLEPGCQGQTVHVQAQLCRCRCS